MPREFARLPIALWSEDAFRDLPQPSQLLYLQLLTSPSLSYAGVADWRPARIAKLGAAWTAADVVAAAAPLRHARWIVVDEETEEVLVRFFVRDDGLLAQPRIAVTMAKAHAAIASPVLRGVLVHELRALHAEQPDLAGWRTVKGEAGQALALLGLRAVDPFTVPVPDASPSASAAVGGPVEGPVAGGVGGPVGGPFGPNAGQDLAPGWGPATPAPSPAPAPAPPTPSLRSGVGPRATPERETATAAAPAVVAAEERPRRSPAALAADEAPLPRCAEHADVLEPPACRACREARLALQAWEDARRERITCPPCPEHPEHVARDCQACAAEAEAAVALAAARGWGSWRDRFADYGLSAVDALDDEEALQAQDDPQSGPEDADGQMVAEYAAVAS